MMIIISNNAKKTFNSKYLQIEIYSQLKSICLILYLNKGILRRQFKKQFKLSYLTLK